MLLPAALPAADIEELGVKRDGQRVTVTAHIRIAASPGQVFDVLTDYDSLSELSNRYIVSGYLEPAANGTPRVHSTVQGCVLFYCQTIRRVAELTAIPTTHITAIVEPEVSDLKYGREVWELSGTDAMTDVIYTHDMETRFWVPPLVGPWAIKRMLAKDALTAAERIEQMARGETPTLD